MARKIADQDEVIEQPAEKPNGVEFVKNHTNELLKFDDGTTYKFKKTKELITDPVLIANIRKIAKRHGIFEQSPPAPAPAQTAATPQ